LPTSAQANDVPSSNSTARGVLPKRKWWQLGSARIAIGFVVWSALWVVMSDYCLHRMVEGAPQAVWTLETIKGLVYVATTGVLLFFFAKAREVEYFAARRTTENRLRRVSESNLICICYWKPTGEITDANDAFLNLIGYTRQELLDRKLNWRSFTPPEYYGKDSEHLRRLLAAGEQVRYEKEFLRKDNTRVPVLVGASMLDASNLRGIAYVLDMSELKKAQERSVELEQQLRQSQKLEAVGQLASGIAHDFNNLLNVIIGYTCLIDAKLHTDEVLSQEAKHILKAAEKASGLIRKLLAFGRKQLLNPELVDVNSTLREYEHILPRLVGEKIRLELKPQSGLWLVEVDRNQLEQVIINLVVNARDAMPYGGALTIQTSNDQQSDCVLITVTDTGIGMTPETKARMFDPFFTTKPEGQGTGLGLSTVYGIVAQSGGRISVSSELGHGTTFSIYLRRATRSAGQAQQPRETARNNVTVLPSKTHETILLAEDETDLRELLTILLRTHGYRVIAAKNGEEAVNLAKKNSGKIELLLTDIVMPHMNGIEASHQIRSFLPDVSVLYMTGYAEEAHSMKKPEENVALLEKPVSPPILIDKIRELLSARMNRRTA
jgi:two-component system, cell cycle sensor histidine kinase and response regulator CckA